MLQLNKKKNTKRKKTEDFNFAKTFSSIWSGLVLSNALLVFKFTLALKTFVEVKIETYLIRVVWTHNENWKEMKLFKIRKNNIQNWN